MKKLLTLLAILPTLTLGSPSKTIELNSKNTINFNQAFSSRFVAEKQTEAINLCFENPGTEINIVLYTPGGSVTAGKLFFDTLNALPCKFNTITIFAASMGYQTVQNLGKRYIIPSGTLMSHRASISGVGGEVGGELNSIIDLITREITEMEMVASNRVGITLEKYQESIRDELWLTAKESVKSNHADEQVLVKCSKDLMGTTFTKVRTFFGTLNVEFSKCPIIVAPISVSSGNQEHFDEVSKMYSNLRNSVLVKK